MLTKKDLSAIREMFKEMSVDLKVGIITQVGKMLQKNTDDLVELITTGFNAQEERSSKFDSLIDNHENRINTLEKKTYNLN